MANRKISTDELTNVSGGIDYDNKKVECPNCKARPYRDKAYKGYSGGGCEDIIEHFECPNCGHKWDINKH